MKTLLVVRHAEACEETSSGVDFDPPLTPRGQRQALDLGRMIRERNLALDAALASPAVRVVETWSGVMEGAGVALEPVYDRRLYNASRETLIEVIRESDEKVERLLVAGHNPGVQRLLLHLAAGDRDNLRAKLAASFPTATLAELRLSVDKWRDVGPQTARIDSLFRPED